MDFSKITQYIEVPRFRHRVWDTKLNFYQVRAVVNNIRLVAFLSLFGALLVAQSMMQANKNIKLINDNVEKQVELLTTQNKILIDFNNDVRKNFIKQDKFNAKILRFQRLVKIALGSINSELAATVGELGKILYDVAIIKTKTSMLSDFTIDQLPQMSAKQDLIVEAIKASSDITIEVTTTLDSSIQEMVASSVAGNAILSTLEATSAEIAAALDLFSAGVLVPLGTIFADYMQPLVSLKIGYWKIHLTGVDTNDEVNVKFKHRPEIDVVNTVDVEVQNFPEDIKVSNFPTSISVNNLDEISIVIPTEISVNNFPKNISVDNFPEIVDVIVRQAVEIQNMPQSIMVSNFPETQNVSVHFPDAISINNFPTEIAVSNMVKPTTEVAISNLPNSIKITNFPTGFEVSNFPKLYPVVQTELLDLEQPIKVVLDGDFIGDDYIIVNVLEHPSLSCCDTQFYDILTQLIPSLQIKEHHCQNMYLEPLMAGFTRTPFIVCNNQHLQCDNTVSNHHILGVDYNSVCDPFIVANPGSYRVVVGTITMETALANKYNSNHIFLACLAVNGQNCQDYVPHYYNSKDVFENKY